MLCYLMHLDAVFLPRQCMYGDCVLFDAGLIFFPFISLLFTSICALPMKKITIALKLFFPSDLVPILFVLF